MTKYRLSRQPQWVQAHIKELEHQIAALQGLKAAHAILCDAERDWFSVQNKEGEVFTLWRLHKDQPHAICTLGPGDTLLVGRAVK